MRTWPLLLSIALLAPTAAMARDAPYYGPFRGLSGVGFKDKVEKDGTWRIEAGDRGDRAIDIAMYRAAELAQAEGHAYVELYDGLARSGHGAVSAVLRARGTADALPSAACRARKGCYVADVTELLRRLSGPDGTQPGVAIVDHVDAYGRAVTISGFGLAAASSTRPVIATVLPVPVRPMATFVPPDPAPTAADRRDAAMAADRPVRGREPTQGWTIGD